MMKKLFTPFVTAFASFLIFTCPKPAVAQSYCIPRYTMVNSQEGISTVKTLLAYQNFNNSNSGVDSTGYGNFMNDSVVTKPADSFMLQAVATTNALHWAVWVDWNIDGDFDDPGELVYENDTLFSNNFSTTIIVPSNADTGVSRMRVMGLHSGNATDPCDILMDGEAEDYAILILGNGSGTGIHSTFKESQSLKIFPNPTNDKLFLESLSGQRFEKVKIWNLLGQIVFQKDLQPTSQTELSLSSLPIGIYHITVQTDKGSMNQRLEILR